MSGLLGEPDATALNNDRPARSRLAEIPIISLETVLLMLTFSLFTWALVRHGERSPGEIAALCESRSQQSSGFQGDADFYGFGIRLGLYLQWISSFITNCFTPTERESVVVTYVIFSLSITIAVLVKVFGQQCTFVAEMFVVLTLFWGGLNVILLVPLLRRATVDRVVEIKLSGKRKDVSQTIKTSQSLQWATNLLNACMSPITIWFWARLAAMGEEDFASSPDHTSLFFFARIRGNGFRALSIFMAVASGINFLWFNWILFPLKVEADRTHEGLEQQFGRLVWFPLKSVLIPFVILFNLASMLTMYIMQKVVFLPVIIIFDLISKIRGIYGFYDSGESRLRTKSVLDNIKEGQCIISIRIASGVPLLPSFWCVVGVELTLRWNSVTGVYKIDTTGQIIPLIAGIGVLLVSISKATEPSNRWCLGLSFGLTQVSEVELSTRESGVDYENSSNRGESNYQT